MTPRFPRGRWQSGASSASAGERRRAFGMPVAALIPSATVLMVTMLAVSACADEASTPSAVTGTATTSRSADTTSTGAPGTTTPDRFPETTSIPAGRSSSTTETSTTTTTRPTSSSSSSTAPRSPRDLVFELRGNGVGFATFGDGEDATIATAKEVLGTPTDESQYGNDNLIPGNLIKNVVWQNVSLVFQRKGGRGIFVGWATIDKAPGFVLPLPNGLRYDMPADELEAKAPRPVTSAMAGRPKVPSLCFPDAGGTICGGGPAASRDNPAPPATITAYVAGYMLGNG